MSTPYCCDVAYGATLEHVTVKCMTPRTLLGVAQTSVDLLGRRTSVVDCYQGKALILGFSLGSKSIVDIYQNTIKVLDNVPVQ